MTCFLATCYSAARELRKALLSSGYYVQYLGLKEVKTESFLTEYWNDPDKLTSSIHAYTSKLGKRKTDELTLANLLK